MPVSPIDSSALPLAGSAGLVATGVAVHGLPASPLGALPAIVLTCVGLFGVTSAVADRSADRLQSAAKRAWLIAIVAVVPHGLATAPSNDRAATAGELFAGPVAGLAAEAAAGAALLCAVAITTVYAMARYGVHPGRPTPEERVLGDD